MRVRRCHAVVGAILGAAGLSGCQSADRAPDAGRAAAETHVVEVAARDYAFDMAAEIPSGWTTFRMSNEGEEHHFFLLTRLPEGKTIADYGTDVGMAFGAAWDALRTGAMDKAEAGQLLGGLLPQWYGSAKAMGGVGLVAPGRVAQTSLNLEPGNYVVECYMKAPDGVFHSVLGMVRALTVTEDSSGAAAPVADMTITLSNHEIAVDGKPAAGRHTVAVRFVEHPEIGLGNDVHLARLTGEQNVGDVAPWMDWMEIDGLEAPAPVEFLGGAQEMPAGYTAYFTVDLEPGRYGWITEASADRGLFREFTVE